MNERGKIMSQKDCLHINVIFEIPNDPEMNENLRAVDDSATSEADSRQIKGLYTWAITTIATSYLENMIKILSLKMNENRDSTVDFCNLLSCTATIRKNEDAEKEGNINISFRPGEFILKESEVGSVGKIKANIRGEFDNVASKFIKINPNHISELDEDLKILHTIEKATIRELNNKNNMVIPSDWLATKVTFIYVKHIYIRLLNLIENGSRAASVNFQDLIEFHVRLVTEEDGQKIKFILRPGVNSKLFIKSDDVTEFTEE